MSKILLITPPFVQTNAPYPATAYLKGYLKSKGIETEQFDLSIELATKVFSSKFISEIFELPLPENADDNLLRIRSLRNTYIKTIDAVITFLQGNDPTLANLICMPDYIPQAARFETMQDIEESFGEMGAQDCAKYIATLYIQDISDYIRATATEHFEIVKYAESIALAVPSFKDLEARLAEPLNIIEKTMTDLLREKLEEQRPEYVGFSIPFPGNLFSALRCAQFIKEHFRDIKTIAGGGYPTTELRSMSDKGVFKYFDYVVLDDGELALERIVTEGRLINTYTLSGYYSSDEKITHFDRGCPDFSGLPHKKYFSLLEVINPMHRLWSDGRWNKIMLAHGCYWAKCAFCDISLDYIGRYDASISAATIVDWMVDIASETNSSGFHFVDEAAPPKMLKEISLEIIRRGLNFTWWTNIRFESAFTGDLCRLMAAAGCIAISGGLESAGERLLKMINKGVSIESATMAMRNFFYAGIMVHTYLMYGVPTQTLQESVDSLEIIRQMFHAELIDSGFWHRYAMTIHSPSGQTPDHYNVKRRNNHVNTFANNEVRFVEDRGYDIHIVGDALRSSLINFMAGNALDRQAHKWFEGKVPHTTVEPTEITDHLIKPDSSRIFNENARLVWIGGEPTATEGGISIEGVSRQKQFNFSEADAAFIIKIMELCSDLSRIVLLAEVKAIYIQFNPEPFSTLYHSKKWDQLREFGLLQI